LHKIAIAIDDPSLLSHRSRFFDSLHSWFEEDSSAAVGDSVPVTHGEGGMLNARLKLNTGGLKFNVFLQVAVLDDSLLCRSIDASFATSGAAGVEFDLGGELEVEAEAGPISSVKAKSTRFLN
jgi:hypothetical protein